MDPKESNSLPKKRARMACVIHCSDEASDNLVSPQNLDSWKSLLRAAEIRQHEPILELARDLPEGEIPPVQYHRKCRSIFTMKKLLDSITKRADSAEPSDDRSRRSSRDAPSTSRVFEKQCIFCEKASKYLKGQNTREPLIQCSELRADDRVRRAATSKQDERMLAITSRELVAAEGHYHRSCYRAYTRGEPADSCEAMDQDEDSEAQYEAAEQNAYDELFFYIRNELFLNPQVLPMTDLTSRLRSTMSNFGFSHVKDSTKKHLRRKLESELAGSIHIISDDKGKLLVYPDSLSMSELAKHAFALNVELKHAKTVNSGDVVKKAALQMRNDIKKQDISSAWPPNVEEDDFIPQSITEFLQTLLTGDSECTNPSERVKRLTTSFGSDLIFAVTCGKKKPPKHLLLPFAVKSLTGNTELIHTLNRLGHSVSYSQVQEVDTALCLQKMELSKDDVPLPTNIYPNVFTTLAWDNIDSFSPASV